MFFARLLDFSWWGLVVQLGAGVVLLGFIVAAWISLFLNHRLQQARSLVADGVIIALGLMTAATLLRTITLRTWHQIALFVIVFSLRLLLKRLFVWEKKRLTAMANQDVAGSLRTLSRM